MSNDAILINKCPLCFRAHLYSLQVHRSYWMGVTHAHVRPIEFTRLFTCPSTDAEFQINMTLLQPHGVDYTDVKPKGYLDIEIDLDDVLNVLRNQNSDRNESSRLLKELQNGDANDLKLPPEGCMYNDLRILGIYEA